MKARFIGDPNDDHSGPEAIEVWGVSFKKGAWTKVDDTVGQAARTHSHFEVDDRPAAPARAGKQS